MEQIKREIMKEMMEKNRTHKKNNHWLIDWKKHKITLNV